MLGVQEGGGGLTCQGQETQTPHGQEVLQPEVLHLGVGGGELTISARALAESHSRSQAIGLALREGHGVAFKTGVPRLPTMPGALLGLWAPRVLRLCRPLGVGGSQTSLRGLSRLGTGQRTIWAGAFAGAPTSPPSSPVSRVFESPYLAAPSQVEAAEGRHGGQIAEASVRDAHAPMVAKAPRP